MVFATRTLPAGFVAGVVRPMAVPYGERRWVDLLPGAFVRLALAVGDRVMIECAGERITGVVQHDGERLAVYCDTEPESDRVLVRRRRDQ